MTVSLDPNNNVVEPVTEGQIPETSKTTPSSNSTSNVKLTEATPADAPAMASLGTKIFTESFGYSIPPGDLAAFLGVTYSAGAFETEMQSPQISTWTAKDSEGTLLGFVQLVRGITDDSLGSEDPAELAHLHRLYVDTNAHGGGIGTKLIAVVEDKARAEGFKKLWLTVWEENTKARRLYERLGFVKVGKTDFVIGKCVQWDWAMIKDLR